MNRPAALAALLLATSLTAHAATLTFTPDQVGDIFCIGTLADDMTRIEDGLLTPALAQTITLAETRNAKLQSQSPDDKPPLGDGLPWRSYPDFADDCTVGTVTTVDSGASVEIKYSFKSDPSANYTDTLQLKKTTGTDRVYQIDDIDQVDGQTFKSALAAASWDTINGALTTYALTPGRVHERFPTRRLSFDLHGAVSQFDCPRGRQRPALTKSRHYLPSHNRLLDFKQQFHAARALRMAGIRPA